MAELEKKEQNKEEMKKDDTTKEKVSYSKASKSAKALEDISEKKLKKVVDGKVKKKSKFAELFIAEDVKDVKSYILKEVLIPEIKSALCDVATDGIQMILYGTSRRDRKKHGDKVSYSSYYSTNRRDSNLSNVGNGYSYGHIIVPSRESAEEILATMDEILERYTIVTVADVFDLIGVTGNYTDNNYGWTSLRTASIVRVRDGYEISLPKAMPVK